MSSVFNSDLFRCGCDGIKFTIYTAALLFAEHFSRSNAVLMSMSFFIVLLFCVFADPPSSSLSLFVTCHELQT